MSNQIESRRKLLNIAKHNRRFPEPLPQKLNPHIPVSLDSLTRFQQMEFGVCYLAMVAAAVGMTVPGGLIPHIESSPTHTTDISPLYTGFQTTLEGVSSFVKGDVASVFETSGFDRILPPSDAEVNRRIASLSMSQLTKAEKRLVDHEGRSGLARLVVGSLNNERVGKGIKPLNTAETVITELMVASGIAVSSDKGLIYVSRDKNTGVIKEEPIPTKEAMQTVLGKLGRTAEQVGAYIASLPGFETLGSMLGIGVMQARTCDSSPEIVSVQGPSQATIAPDMQKTAVALGKDQLDSTKKYEMFMFGTLAADAGAGAISLDPSQIFLSEAAKQAGARLIMEGERVVAIAMPLTVIASLVVNPGIVQDVIEGPPRTLDGRQLNIQEAAILRANPNIHMLQNGTLVDRIGEPLVRIIPTIDDAATMERAVINMNQTIEGDFYRGKKNPCSGHENRTKRTLQEMLKTGRQWGEIQRHSHSQAEAMLNIDKILKEMNLSPKELKVLYGNTLNREALNSLLSRYSPQQLDRWLQIFNIDDPSSDKQTKITLLQTQLIDYPRQLVREEQEGTCQEWDLRRFLTSELDTFYRFMNELRGIWIQK